MFFGYETLYDHTPAADYRIVTSQTKYTLAYSPDFAGTKSYGYDKGGSQNAAYKLTDRLAKIFLVFSCVVFACLMVAGAASIITHGKYYALEEAVYWLLLGLSFGLPLSALFQYGIPKWMKNAAAKKEEVQSIGLHGKTMILDSGKVVVSDEQNERTVQIGRNGVHRPMEDAPFRKMITINNVHSVTHANGKIAAEADICELYRHHHIKVNEYNNPPESDPTKWYYYRRRYRKSTIYWYETMYGSELLLQALQGLK